MHSGGMAICVECDRRFTPSSRHPACPACRSKDTCACGRTKQKKSERCAACWAQHGQVGSTNFNWRGGRTRHHQGYMMVHLPGHPRARTMGYVFEHILVVEQELGRHLEDFENVHHRNGVRDDNRLENLELWTRPQPSGIRARDALEWAREILQRYGDLPGTL